MMMWAAFGPNGEVLIYDEWPEEDHAQLRSSEFTVADYTRIIHEREFRQKLDFRCLDPRFGAAQPSVKGIRMTTIQEDFAKEGLVFDCQLEGTEREEIGIQLVRELLRFDRGAPISPLNIPKLRVRASCINTINALRLSNFKAPSLLDPEKLEEKVNERYKDARDCLRYLCLYNRQGIGVTDDSFTYIEDSAREEDNDFNSF